MRKTRKTIQEQIGKNSKISFKSYLIVYLATRVYSPIPSHGARVCACVCEQEVRVKLKLGYWGAITVDGKHFASFERGFIVKQHIRVYRTLYAIHLILVFFLL